MNLHPIPMMATFGPKGKEHPPCKFQGLLERSVHDLARFHHHQIAFVSWKKYSSQHLQVPDIININVKKIYK